MNVFHRLTGSAALRARLALGLALLGCAGCGKRAATDTDPEPVVHCSDDPRVSAYSANLTQTGAKGLYKFVLVSANPAPPARDLNAWTVQVQDAQGNALSGVQLAVKLWMPDHGHGPATVPLIAANGTTESVKQMNLFMAGVWEVTLTATASGQTDSAVFTFCVEG